MTKETDTKNTRDQIPLLSPEIKKLPLICQQEIKTLLAFLADTERKKVWFKTRTPQELNPLLGQAAKTSQEIFSLLKPFKEIDSSWYEAFDKAEATSLETAWNTGRDAAIHKARNTARALAKRIARPQARHAYWHTDWDPVSEAAEYAAFAAGWETVKDIPPFNLHRNPFLPFLGLYALGATKMNFVTLEKEERLVVDFPILVKDREVSGCVFFNADGSYDQQVSRIHSWQEECSKRQPLP